MQCEGREWVTLFTPEAVAGFDYIFTDAMTWTDDKGRRMRLWMPDETFVDNDQQFMDMLVGKIEAIMEAEPVDIYVNPTFLPAQLAPRYDELWTKERMDRVVNVLLRNQVALEINSRYKIPSIAFLKRAKAAGVKFTFGTNNTLSDDLNRLEYSIKAIKEVGLTTNDMFFPRPKSERKILKKGCLERSQVKKEGETGRMGEGAMRKWKMGKRERSLSEVEGFPVKHCASPCNNYLTANQAIVFQTRNSKLQNLFP